MFKKIEGFVKNGLKVVAEKISNVWSHIKDFAVSVYKKVIKPLLGGLLLLLKVILVVSLIYLYLVQFSTPLLEGIRENSPFLVAAGIFGFLLVFVGVILLSSTILGTENNNFELLSQIREQKQKLNEMKRELTDIKTQLFFLRTAIETSEINRQVDRIKDKSEELEEKYR